MITTTMDHVIISTRNRTVTRATQRNALLHKFARCYPNKRRDAQTNAVSTEADHATEAVAVSCRLCVATRTHAESKTEARTGHSQEQITRRGLSH